MLHTTLQFLWSILLIVAGALGYSVIERATGYSLNSVYDWLRAKRQSMMAERLRVSHQGHDFTCGGISAPIYVYDIEPRPGGYRIEDIHFDDDLQHPPMIIPDDCKVICADLLPSLERDLRDGKFYDNRDVVGLASLRQNLQEPQEYHTLSMTGRVGRYLDHLLTIKAFQTLSDAERRKALEVGREVPHPFFSTLAAVALAVITTDAKVMFHRRGNRIYKDPTLWVCGVSEGLKAVDCTQTAPGAVSHERTGGRTAHQILKPPAPLNAAWRGLHEECGVKLGLDEIASIVLRAVVLNTRLYEWYFVGHIDLRETAHHKLNSAELESSIKNCASDRGREIGEIAFVPYNPRAVAQFLFANEAELTEWGKVAAVYSFLEQGHEWPKLQEAFSR